jgi:tetratricopeptide (TPR) repeat protein
MKSKKHESRKSAAPAAPAGDSSRLLFYALAAVALVAVWWAYSPVFHAPFLFDDTVQLYGLSGVPSSFQAWVLNWRPMVSFTYWVNFLLSGTDTFSYHVLSLLIHVAVVPFVFLIVRRLLEWSGAPESRRGLLAGFAAAIFLLHPAQTEAVAYVAGRSEAISVLFAYAAFAVFLYRPRPAASWKTAVAVLTLFAAAVLSKQQTVVLPALLLLTDYWWNPGFSFKGIRGNWLIYAPMALGAAAGVAFFWELIRHSTSAGFGLQDLPWYKYLFTEFRALFVYLGIFVLPVRLDADWDFAISQTILDRGAILGLAVLLALIAAAWHYRRRFPLATFGFFAFLVLMAPTSSILPIKDPVAERRLYTSMLGLLLIAVDVLARIKVERRVLGWSCAAIALAASIGTHARAEVWSSPVGLWEDTAGKSPNKSRVHQQLAQAYYDEQRYAAAIPEFEKSARLELPEYNMLINWALAYQRMGQFDQALAKLRQAATLEQTAHVYSQIGMIYVQRKQRAEALDALATAQKIDPNWAPTYNYRAKLYFQANELPEAVAQYQQALALDARLADARDELARAEAMLRARPQ